MIVGVESVSVTCRHPACTVKMNLNTVYHYVGKGKTNMNDKERKEMIVPENDGGKRRRCP